MQIKKWKAGIKLNELTLSIFLFLLISMYFCQHQLNHFLDWCTSMVSRHWRKNKCCQLKNKKSLADWRLTWLRADIKLNELTLSIFLFCCWFQCIFVNINSTIVLMKNKCCKFKRKKPTSNWRNWHCRFFVFCWFQFIFVNINSTIFWCTDML